MGTACYLLLLQHRDPVLVAAGNNLSGNREPACEPSGRGAGRGLNTGSALVVSLVCSASCFSLNVVGLAMRWRGPYGRRASSCRTYSEDRGMRLLDLADLLQWYWSGGGQSARSVSGPRLILRYASASWLHTWLKYAWCWCSIWFYCSCSAACSAACAVMMT
jgi:hypothetical protein